MRHMLGMSAPAPVTAGATAPHAPMLQDLRTRLAQHTNPHRPFVTLSYAQSLDGSIAAQPSAHATQRPRSRGHDPRPARRA
ncbi:MAG: hypothetical protein R2854_18705 [Caldilineaceae bacterium]